MSYDPNTPKSRDAELDALVQLISRSGRREDPPPRAYEQTLHVATQAWRIKVRRRRWRVVAAVAATVILAMGSLLAWQSMLSTPAAPVVVAHVERALGEIEIKLGRSQWQRVSEERQALASGTRLRTSSTGGAGLLLSGGQSVRLAPSTELNLLADNELELVRGKTYVDTGPDRIAPLTVITPVGTAIDVGTQFEIQFLDGRYRMRVREGAVLLQRTATRIRSDAGEQLVVNPDGAIERARFSPLDPDWQWATTLASAPQIDGHSLTVLLAWVARETGRKVEYADDEARDRTARTILHGNIEHLSPLEALRVMLATTDLHYRLRDDGSILIELGDDTKHR
jgi:ferric-dicitrate binding protein FerR (iron transport regulator)